MSYIGTGANRLSEIAALLPFAKEHTIVPMLFLKNAPEGGRKNVKTAEDIIELSK